MRNLLGSVLVFFVVLPSALISQGTITTFAGSTPPVSAVSGQAVSATIGAVGAVVSTADGTIYAKEFGGGSRLLSISPAGIISVVGGPQTTFGSSFSLAADNTGAVYVPDNL